MKHAVLGMPCQAPASGRHGPGMVTVAERAGVSRSTLHLMGNGSAGTSPGKLVQVLAVLGLEQDLSAVGIDDVLGRKLEDARLTETRRRAPKRKLKE